MAGGSSEWRVVKQTSATHCPVRCFLRLNLSMASYSPLSLLHVYCFMPVRPLESFHCPLLLLYLCTLRHIGCIR
jgi:hypothetical protein